ncbi:ABC transporter ATP-binding protein [Paenibacillaceae bacterium]|nr:ABC transporter ATP-binding protein [Paenibacillaceae bacterium]
MIFLLICGLLSVLALISQLLIPYSNKVLVDGVLIEGSMQYLWLSVFLFGLSAVGYLIFSQTHNILFTKVEESILLKIKLDIHSKFRNLKDVHKHDLGEKMSYYTNDANLLKESYRAILGLLLGVIQIIMIFFIILTIDWRFSLIMLLLIPIFSIWPRIVGKGIHKKSIIVQESEQKVMSGLTDSLRLSTEIRVFHKEDWDFKSIAGIFKSIIKPKIVLQMWNALMSFNQLFYWIIICIIMYFGGRMVIEGSVSAGFLIALINYLGFVNEPVHSIINNYSKIQTVKGAVGRLDHLFQLEDRGNGTERLESKEIPIEVSNLYYIVEGKSILKNVSFTVKQGEFVGIIGKSGSGKSSLLKIICKLIEPDEGKITFQDRDIHSIDNNSFYSNVCIVTQDSYFFKGSISENLMLGGEYGIDEIKEAIHQVGLSDVVNERVEQTNSQLGEDANTLSGGQKQRLAIIRAVLKETPILLLDEVTSALDLATEKEVMEYIKRLRKGKTTIFVTHRIHTVKDSDWIMIMENGEIQEQGTHQKLLDSRYYNGLYETYNEGVG